MATLIHADIFFFVTTIAVVVVAILFVAIIIYVLAILNDLHYISGVVRKETNLLAEDLEDIRERVKREGALSLFMNLFTGLFGGRGKRSKTNKSKDAKETK